MGQGTGAGGFTANHNIYHEPISQTSNIGGIRSLEILPQKSLKKLITNVLWRKAVRHGLWCYNDATALASYMELPMKTNGCYQI